MPQKKSAAGSGSIRKKTTVKNGKAYTFWEGRITVGIDPKTGKQKQRSVSGKTKKEVAQKLRQLTTEIDQGTYQEPTKITVGGWLDTWTELYLGDVKPRTADLYKRTIEVYLKPAFGGLKLEKLKSIDVQRLYTELQNQEKPLSPKTIRNIHGVLHKALQQAVELGYIRTKPSDPCKLPKVEKATIKPLDNEAMKAFLEVIRCHQYENICLVTLFTGMWEGEVLGLKWDSIDFQNGTILISQQLQRNVDGTGGFTFVSPKNGKARKIAPASFVMDILRQQQEKQAQWKDEAGEVWEDTGLVFTNELGHNLTPRSVYGHFKKLIAQAGYPEARFHDGGVKIGLNQ